MPIGIIAFLGVGVAIQILFFDLFRDDSSENEKYESKSFSRLMDNLEKVSSKKFSEKEKE